MQISGKKLKEKIIEKNLWEIETNPKGIKVEHEFIKKEDSILDKITGKEYSVPVGFQQVYDIKPPSEEWRLPTIWELLELLEPVRNPIYLDPIFLLKWPYEIRDLGRCYNFLTISEDKFPEKKSQWSSWGRQWGVDFGRGYFTDFSGNCSVIPFFIKIL